MSQKKNKQIKLVREICEIAEKDGSVYHSRWGRTVPGKWMQNMSAVILVGYIRMGWLYYYTPKSKQCTKKETTGQ